MAGIVAGPQMQLAHCIVAPQGIDVIVAAGRQAHCHSNILQDAQVNRRYVHIGAVADRGRHQVAAIGAAFAEVRQASWFERNAGRRAGGCFRIRAGEFSVLHEGVVDANPRKGAAFAGIDDAQPMSDFVQEYRQGVDAVARHRRAVVGLEGQHVADGVYGQVDGEIGSGAIDVCAGAQFDSGVGVINRFAVEGGAGRAKGVRSALCQDVAAEKTVVDRDCQVERDIGGGKVMRPERGRRVHRVQHCLLLGRRQARKVRRTRGVE
jgi:hypothetical protein